MANPDKYKLRLTEFDKDNINESILESVKKIINNPENQIANKAVMEKKSKAAAQLGFWAYNIVQYNDIYKKVKPL